MNSCFKSIKRVVYLARIKTLAVLIDLFSLFWWYCIKNDLFFKSFNWMTDKGKLKYSEQIYCQQFFLSTKGNLFVTYRLLFSVRIFSLRLGSSNCLVRTVALYRSLLALLSHSDYTDTNIFLRNSIRITLFRNKSFLFLS